MRVVDLEAIRIKLASPDDILAWSHGEVTKPETINYRTQRAEKDGLFDERIFGPEKDYECYCGKYRKIRYKGVVCDRCGVEVTKASVRRERMGHIKLAAPCSHIWFLRGVPSRMGLVLDIPAQSLERVIYFAAYIVTKVDEEARKNLLEQIDQEWRQKSKGKEDKEKEALKEARDRARQELNGLDRFRILGETEYQHLSLRYGEVFEAGTGGEVLRKLFEEVDLKKMMAQLEEELAGVTPQQRKKVLIRLRMIRGMAEAKIRPESMFLTVLPVLPPDLRPMVQLDGGRYASSDLNDLYRRVINRNNRLKYLQEIGAPEVIVRNEKRMLQEAVDALIDNSMRKGTMTNATTGGRRLLKSLADMLKGKQGRFRQNLLGKRVDYSGRSVIVVGPSLKLYQCGLPKRMALELFKPFVINGILERELAYNVRGASRLIEQEIDEVWAILEDVVKDRVVMLNRAPTLHRLGIQAFFPVLVEGEAIQLHPLVCEAFNADFDGDQMAVHVPLSDEAQKEARELMLSVNNLLKPATGNPIVAPRQDMVLGCYYLTGEDGTPTDEKQIRYFSSPEEVIMAYENNAVGLRERMRVRRNGEMLETTPGRLIFNGMLPEGYRFVNEQVNSKKIGALIGDIIKKYPQQKAQELLDGIKELGFEYATKSGTTWGMTDLVVPVEKKGLLQEAEKEIAIIENHWRNGLLSREEKGAKVIEVWQRVKSTVEKLVPKTLPAGGSVFSIIDSGSRGSWSQPIQMSGMKGLVINPAGRIIELPVKNSFKEGFDVLEYFISTHGARKGTADTALRTSTAGYLTRRLIDVAHDILVVEEDCKDHKGLLLSKKQIEEIGQNIVLKIGGRISVDALGTHVKKGGEITWEIAQQIGADPEIQEFRVRSPLTCKAQRGVCRMCYGWDLGAGRMIELGSAVGIIAAQSIGEPGTQLTMRTFHTGGVAGGGDITQGLPRVEEIFEGRVPGGKAILSEVEGIVMEITPDGIIRIKPTKGTEIPKKEGKATRKKKKDEKEEKKDEKAEELVEYQMPPKRAIWVEVNGFVQKGQQLCEGSLELEEVFRTSGQDEAKRYIVQEVQRIYTTQGASIHDKHIEVITRQMFSRVRIKNRADSKFSEGEVMERTLFLEENDRLEKQGKQKAEGNPMLLGISKIALTTGSFLSAASFQETSRVLIQAALEGKEDKLRGLKENVILGKLIPAGTGFKK
ncbi:MAG: DNA-directed RNA polymerase subunit beta' [Candidatus Wildermuthbacteria bacterium RIFCSPHIGHO2_01_FULL_45_20]|uniref:DNA-directed RNA polymerase subunit beta' n=1 Tax=Candidatus Wildermuthbacteria bacterium RIFCSPHIGHO2_02_FULL_45_25 TaxID=1802450 RepID=A0A1G2R3R4_9BACT|nr:MAG: DNA-directed RNA polymerase subunit beta' [Candidatus Wildermuthbacteria bacterium RIFCSPHIGHO2_01_FULL_45_20]OHA67466.1 MAG: DNA-directed RNA polymerase subunit beta' [Candidatus Wildermuthbacteria bacterium RIFCSPHIGHO2_02_FULL_45_25]